MVIGKIGQGYGYDFRMMGKRYRKARFRSRAEAAAAETRRRAEVSSGKEQVTMADAYAKFIDSKKFAKVTLEHYARFWERDIKKALGHLYVEDVRTSKIDALKSKFPKNWGPKSINQRLILIRAVLRFAWKREWLANVPHVPMEKLPRSAPEWYSIQERDQLLQGIFDLQPQWYLFFYLTMRLGLRSQEIYPIEHRQFERDKGLLRIDQAAERGTKDRPAELKLRKANDMLVHELTPDVLAAYDWHCRTGYAGMHLVFSATDTIPRYLDSHKVPLRIVQERLGLRKLGHHTVGRHSVASQAVAAGMHMKAIQALLGHKSEQSTHKYAHARGDAQREIVERLRADKAPHEVN